MSTSKPTRTRGVGRHCGFTLIELIAVIVIVAIMAGVSAPALTTLSSQRAAAASRDIWRDLAWARQHAVATGTTTWVVFDDAADTWSVLVEDPDNPGRVDAAVITDMSSGQPWTRTLGSGTFVAVEITAVDFDGDDEIGFDWLGRPYAGTETALVAQGTVTVTGGHTASVEIGTGLPRYVAP